VSKAFIVDVSSGKAAHSNSALTQSSSHARTQCHPPTWHMESHWSKLLSSIPDVDASCVIVQNESVASLLSHKKCHCSLLTVDVISHRPYLWTNPCGRPLRLVAAAAYSDLRTMPNILQPPPPPRPDLPGDLIPTIRPGQVALVIMRARPEGDRLVFSDDATALLPPTAGLLTWLATRVL
jgi:hypothetical protein